MGDHAADAVVEMGEHRGEDPAVEVREVSEFREVGVGGLHGAVDSVVGEVEKKRLGAVARDKIVGLAGEGVGEIGALVDGLTGAEEGIVGVIVGLVAAHVRGPDEAAVGRGPPAGAAVGESAAAQPGGDARPRVGNVSVALVEEAEKFVEAATLWVEFGGAAEVPLADERGGVAGGAEVIGDGFFADGQTDAGRGVFRTDGIKFKTETGLVATGEQRGAGGGAERGGDVTVGEAHAAGREGIEVRCGDFFAAVATEFAVTEIVGDDKDDVGARLRFGRCSDHDMGAGDGEAEEEAQGLHDFVGVG